MVDQNERNRLLVEEFRANSGRVAEETFAGGSLLLLTTHGRKSGRRYVNPLTYLPDGERYVVFASHQGAAKDPDWFKNLVSDKTATIEVGADTLEVTVSIVTGPERDALYARQVSLHPRFGDYAQRTDRQIPVVALQPT